MRYLYETHLHTNEASACASISGAEHVRNYKKAGYEGIFITDHFFTGNTSVPRDLPWEEWVDSFCAGYYNAKKEGDRIGLSVFFGWESYYKATEFLVYGLDDVWLKQNPEILTWSIQEQYENIHAAGGFVVHAHPFRIRPYIKEVRLFPQYVDAVEVYNLGNGNEEFDRKAHDYAVKHGLPMTAGTDAHRNEMTKSGIAFDHKLNDVSDFITSVKAGRGYQLLRATE